MEDLYGHLTGLFKSSDDPAFAATGLEVIGELKKGVTLPGDQLIGATEAFAIIDSLKHVYSAVYRPDEQGRLTVDTRVLSEVIKVINEMEDARSMTEEARASVQETLDS